MIEETVPRDLRIDYPAEEELLAACECAHEWFQAWIEKMVGVEVPELASGMVPGDNRAQETLFEAEGGQV